MSLSSLISCCTLLLFSSTPLASSAPRPYSVPLVWSCAPCSSPSPRTVSDPVVFRWHNASPPTPTCSPSCRRCLSIRECGSPPVCRWAFAISCVAIAYRRRYINFTGSCVQSISYSDDWEQSNSIGWHLANTILKLSPQRLSLLSAFRLVSVLQECVIKYIIIESKHHSCYETVVMPTSSSKVIVIRS